MNPIRRGMAALAALAVAACLLLPTAVRAADTAAPAATATVRVVTDATG